MGYDHPYDTVRVVGASVYGILGTAMMFICLTMYRHDQRNKRAVYIRRYQSYINTISLIACSMWITCVGKLLPIMDILENDSARYGWWIAYAFYLSLAILALSAYHRLTIFGILLACLMSILSSLSTIFLATTDSVQGRALFSITASLSLLFAHFFVWWKSNRDYTSANRVRAQVLGGCMSYTVVDKLVLVLSTTFALFILAALILGDEVTHVFGELVSEILNVVFVWAHWSVVALIVFFWFMDVGHQASVDISTQPSLEMMKYNWKRDKRGPEVVRREHDIFKVPVTRPLPLSPFDE